MEVIPLVCEGCQGELFRMSARSFDGELYVVYVACAGCGGEMSGYQAQGSLKLKVLDRKRAEVEAQLKVPIVRQT